MMRKELVLFVWFLFSSTFAQSDKEFDDLINAEKKSSFAKFEFVVNPNTSNYDITYCKLEFSVDPAEQFISGKVTSEYKALEDLETIIFELANNLTVSSIKQNGVNLTFNQNVTNELEIIFTKTQPKGSTSSVEIVYSGVPISTGLGAFTTTTHNEIPVLWTLSEPFGALEWWPCKQDLNDKIEAVDIYITAPSEYVSVSNGIEPELPIVNGKFKTTHFRHNYPIPAYLIAIAVTNYSIYTQLVGAGPNQYPIVNYLYPEDFDANVPLLDQTPKIMNFFESVFEPYPFKNEKYGHAQFSWGGGMEHTTVSFMGSFNRGLIAHELAHQWFGDKITCGSWNDIWLNEGFATYLSSMVIEHFDGNESFVLHKTGMINNITSLPNGSVYIPDEEMADESRIFNGRLSYQKGAMVLNMLRFKLGDAIFFQAIKNYLNDTKLAYSYAKTPDLQSHLEAVSGLNLSEFFNDWVYNQGYPIYDIIVNPISNGEVKITINQSQSDLSVTFFEMPVPIRLVGIENESIDVVLDNKVNGESFIVDIPFEVTSMIFDPNKELISKDNTNNLSNLDFNFNSEVVIFPNPSNYEINIGLPNQIDIQKSIIYNFLGQKIIETDQKTISTENLANGVYTIQINTSKGNFHKKFIKK
ncbi:MAG TPA: M1 family aminopeptidase [Flavobacterium sp.]|jgi:aminopeptidase N|nr:M1 family aminopeptidase [Flavobacterium sp.]